MANAKGSRSAGGNSARPKAAKGYRHPDKLPKGEILTDLFKQKWIVGNSIGIGGFGEIYSACNASKEGNNNDDDTVVKIEPFENGPLFVESHFYLRAGKEETISNWMHKNKLKFLGVPRWYGNGFHVFKNSKYRFMVIQRLGTDVQRKLEHLGGRFSLKTVLTLGLKILDALNFIHESGYVHNDIKAGNLILGPNSSDEVYLVDYGLCCRYLNSEGASKEYRKDPKCAHDGTLIYTSRDAHDGASYSRRGDLEILCYNMVQWLTGSLPWENTKNPVAVMEQKHKLIQNPAQFKQLSELPREMMQFVAYIGKLQFTSAPDYGHCKKLFESALKRHGLKLDGKLELDEPKKPRIAQKGRKPSPADEVSDEVEVKKLRRSPRKTTTTTPSKNNSKVARKNGEDVERATEAREEAPELTNPTPAMRSVMAQLQQQQQQEKKKAPRTEPKSKAVARKIPGAPTRSRATRSASRDISPDLF